jgi:hypothetical protein
MSLMREVAWYLLAAVLAALIVLGVFLVIALGR